MKKSFRQYIAEFLGTFTLVFIGTSVATLQGFLSGYGNTGWLGISFAFGFTLMVLVWVIGPVSGCHVNPAVTIPMAISGRLPWGQVPGYLIAQILGALAASGLLLGLRLGIGIDRPVSVGHLFGNQKGFHPWFRRTGDRGVPFHRPSRRGPTWRRLSKPGSKHRPRGFRGRGSVEHSVGFYRCSPSRRNYRLAPI